MKQVAKLRKEIKEKIKFGANLKKTDLKGDAVQN